MTLRPSGPVRFPITGANWFVRKDFESGCYNTQARSAEEFVAGGTAAWVAGEGPLGLSA